MVHYVVLPPCFMTVLVKYCNYATLNFHQNLRRAVPYLTSYCFDCFLVMDSPSLLLEVLQHI